MASSTHQTLSSAFVVGQIQALPVTAEQVESATRRDPVLSKIHKYVREGWPTQLQQKKASLTTTTDWTTEGRILLLGSRVVIPQKWRGRLLQELDQTHQGIARMKAVARSYKWWPGVNKKIEKCCKDVWSVSVQGAHVQCPHLCLCRPVGWEDSFESPHRGLKVQSFPRTTIELARYACVWLPLAGQQTIYIQWQFLQQICGCMAYIKLCQCRTMQGICSQLYGYGGSLIGYYVYACMQSVQYTTQLK